jgi:hypothetical protein
MYFSVINNTVGALLTLQLFLLLWSISSTFYKQLLRQKLQSQIVTREKLRKTLSYEKVKRNMLMKLKPSRVKKYRNR